MIFDLLAEAGETPSRMRAQRNFFDFIECDETSQFDCIVSPLPRPDSDDSLRKPKTSDFLCCRTRHYDWSLITRKPTNRLNLAPNISRAQLFRSPRRECGECSQIICEFEHNKKAWRCLLTCLSGYIVVFAWESSTHGSFCATFSH